MEPIVWLFVIIAGIGAIAIGAVGLAALFVWWWFLIPAIGALVGGWLGFFFGIGLVVIIWLFVLGSNGDGK